MSRTNATDVGDGECGLDGSSVYSDWIVSSSEITVIDSENWCEMPQNSAALPSGAVAFFWRVQVGMKMTLAGVFLTSGRGRARLIVLSSYFPLMRLESAACSWGDRNVSKQGPSNRKRPWTQP